MGAMVGSAPLHPEVFERHRSLCFPQGCKVLSDLPSYMRLGLRFTGFPAMVQLLPPRSRSRRESSANSQLCVWGLGEPWIQWMDSGSDQSHDGAITCHPRVLTVMGGDNDALGPWSTRTTWTQVPQRLPVSPLSSSPRK